MVLLLAPNTAFSAGNVGVVCDDAPLIARHEGATRWARAPAYAELARTGSRWSLVTLTLRRRLGWALCQSQHIASVTELMDARRRSIAEGQVYRDRHEAIRAQVYTALTD